MNDTIRPHEITSILAQELASFEDPTTLEEVGTVLQVGDGVARIYGLTKVQVGELITFASGVQGLVLNLATEHVGAVILGATHKVKEGHSVQRTGHVGTVQVTEALIGRVVNTFAQPIDGKGDIEGPFYAMPLERKAPGVIYREPVTEPLQTGIKAIDAMVPIGLGQRELLIGDRQTGKTTIALDTIINQRERYEQGDPIHCIYVAIGQKASTVSHLVATLTEYGAMDYTTVVIASASDPAPLQYLAPFVGVTIGEYFRDTGRHALVVYDDLSKQAAAYREIALLLHRPPGREAYPGDIFYLDARLLERAAKLSRNDAIAQQMNDIPPALQGKIRGGGSLTALPIVETQAGDVSAYIPTNVISITDGQIFLDTHLFNAGVKPAIDVGISVSRVGGAAQCKSIKQLSGTLKLAQAQFQELEAFAKFGADLDASTQRVIDRGRKNRELLKQRPYAPLSVAHQVALLYVATQDLLAGLPLAQIEDFVQAYHYTLSNHHNETLDLMAQGNPLDEATEQHLRKVTQDVIEAITK